MPARIRTRRFGRALVGAAVVAVALCLPARSAVAATLTRGPYLQLLGTDAVTIVWNTDVAAGCAVRIRTVGGDPTVVQGTTGKVCAVPVSGLTPGTTYGYTPLADTSPVGAEAAFRTDHPALPYTFLVFGDSGSGSPEQFAVRDGMLATHADLILHTGDMIYPEAETAAWNPKYFVPYADLLRKLVLWPCLGNHDVRKDNGKSWRAAFYTPANNAAVDEDYYSFDRGNAHFVMLDSNSSLTPGSPQHTFLNQDLAASTAAWNFVFFHHTIYSGGEHGSDLGLQERLVPVFDALAVDVVFMGHDHHYERTWPLLANQIVQPGQGTLYITTGGGGAELRDVEPRPLTAYAESSSHFLKVSVAGQSLRVDMVRADGSIGDSISLLKGAPPACGDGVVNQVGEACDGADDVACPGRCNASCACASLCGDGVQQAPVEECDWLDDSQCPGLCITDCTCAEDPGSLDLAPLADTFIEARDLPPGTTDESNWDHGGEKEISVDADPYRIIYLKFDVSAVTRPVASANLSLYCINSSDKGGTIHPVADSSWIEGAGVGAGGAGGPGLKWTDVDTNGDGLLDGAETSPYLPLFTEVITEIGPVAEDDRYLVDVAAALEGGPGLLTLAIAGGAIDGAAYASKEDNNPAERPLLHIDFDLECRSDQDCTDGVLCNGTEQCLRGHCAAAPPEDCDDGSSCTVDWCDVLADECRHDPVADGSACDDGDLCTQGQTGDVCQGGTCVGGAAVVCGASDQCHEAAVCNPATGLCAAAPVADGTPCDDGNACTQSDTCQSGVCAGEPRVECPAVDSCHAPGTCNPATGLCVNPPLPEGTPCDDGSLCTTGERCQGLACTGGAPVVCTAADQCHTAGVCDPATGLCTSPPAADGTPCDDGDACTEGQDGDVCQGGTCVGGAPVICTASDQCHDVGTCDSVSGQCSNPPLGDGTPCDDGSACTQSDSCQAGACVGAEPVVCPAPEPCHVAGVCNPQNGQCTSPPAPNGTVCDDGDACTRTDTCQAGTCVGGVPVVCTASDQCHDAGTCDPASGECTNPAAADGTACSDGNACTQQHGEVCQAGTCVGGVPVVCTASDQCHDAGTCDPASGQCTNPPAANGTGCSDGNACTQTDTCQAGACAGSNPVVCPAPAACHAAGVCNPASGQCTSPPVANGTPCDDGNACTRSDTCQAGSCIGANPVVCVVSGQCDQSGVCDPATGACAVVPKADGTSCSDGDPCTQGDRCQTGACVAGNPVVCAPLDQCHAAGTCNPVTGQCTHPAKANNAPCEDGNPCTLTDTCRSGVCAPGPPRSCMPLDQCHQAGTCQRATGQCTNPPMPNNWVCEDGNPCTQGDKCTAGTCVGGPAVICTPLDACHRAGVCDPATGCSNPEAPDGTPCDDGSVCTQEDACHGGVCSGTAPTVCVALDQCHDAGECDPVTGVCSQPAKADGAPCDDGDACTAGDVCMAGACVAGAPVTCVPLDTCHDAGECDPATGACSQPANADGTPCDDGDACTAGDVCTAGACLSGAPTVCVALDQCHDAGTCDPATGVCSQPAKADGTPCDDGNRCTKGDACRGGGACAAGAPVVCSPVDACHVASCDAATGVCSQTAKADGAPCDDGNRCTEGDACRAGSCVPDGPITCTPVDQCHEAGTCDPATGLCSQPVKADGTPCDDGNQCTRQDTCAGGACVGSDPVTCTAIDQCHEAGACVPATGSCPSPAKADGTPCDDGAFCTVGDACVAAVCRGTMRECAGGACRDGTCDETIDACTLRPKADGLACDDGAYCTVGDACRAGLCTGTPRVCAPASPCRVGRCEEAFDLCLIEPGPDGTPCDDGAFCTVSDACAAGMCGGTPRDCGAPGAVAACHDRVCDEAIDACTVRPEPNGAGCDDGAFCTVGDACRDGVCGGMPRDCSVAVTGPCQDGTCDEVRDTCSGSPKPDGSACSDADACTRSDVCVGGVCRSGDRVECTPDDPCRMAGVCDRTTGLCSSPPRLDSARCDDGNACTAADRCLDGRCTGAPLPDADADGVCDDADTCPLVADPAQADADGDGIGDLCQCTAPAPGRCVAGDGSRRTDCLLEFITTGRPSFNRRGTKLKSRVWCTDGDPVCDVDETRDGVCTFGVALCFGNADPRYPACTPFPVRSVEVVSPSLSKNLPADQLRNIQALEGAAQALGLQVRHGGRIIVPALRPVGDGLCGPLMRLTAPAPAGDKARGMQRTLKLRAVAADGRRDQDKLTLMCER